MNAYGIDGVQLSKNTGIPTTTIHRLRNSDPTINPTLQTLIPIARFFSITVSQLIGEDISNPHTGLQEKLTRVPIIAWHESINWPNITDNPRTEVITDSQCSDKTFSLIVKDELEKFLKGGILYIDPSPTPAHNDFVLVYKQGQTIPSLKQILIDDTQTFLKSTITSSSIIELTSDFKILGVLIEYKKCFINFLLSSKLAEALNN